jgi:excisionase family DNA binding protein
MSKANACQTSEPLAFSIRQVAQLVQVHQNTVRAMLRKGKLTGVRIGSVWRIPRREMLRLCGEQETKEEGTREGCKTEQNL